MRVYIPFAIHFTAHAWPRNQCFQTLQGLIPMISFRVSGIGATDHLCSQCMWLCRHACDRVSGRVYRKTWRWLHAQGACVYASPLSSTQPTKKGGGMRGGVRVDTSARGYMPRRSFPTMGPPPCLPRPMWRIFFGDCKIFHQELLPLSPNDPKIGKSPPKWVGPPHKTKSKPRSPSKYQILNGLGIIIKKYT
jgi:hypothetical protein